MLTKMQKIMIVLMTMLVALTFGIAIAQSNNTITSNDSVYTPLPKEISNSNLWWKMYATGWIKDITHDKTGKDIIHFELTMKGNRPPKNITTTEIKPGVIVPAYRNCLLGIFFMAYEIANPANDRIELLDIFDAKSYEGNICNVTTVSEEEREKYPKKMPVDGSTSNIS